MRKYILIAFTGYLSFAYSFSTFAQTAVFQTLNRDRYMAKVKLLDEFFQRFNGDEHYGEINSECTDRKNSILMLFNLAEFKSKTDTNFIAAQEFAEKAVKSGTLLHYEDRNWYARVKCHGKLGQENINFHLYLCIEERDSAIFSWSISNVEGDIFYTSRDRPHREFSIMPNDNEQFFQSLGRITTETYKFIDDYAVKEYRASPLSVFLTMVRSNLLKIQAVTDVEFYFLQIPEYMFVVRHFERESKNSGWLIDSCKKCSEENKKKFLIFLSR